MKKTETLTSNRPGRDAEVVVTCASSSAARHHRAHAETPAKSPRELRLAQAKAKLHERTTRWLEHNDPEVYFNHVSHARRIARILEMTKDIQGRIVDVGPFAGVLAERIIAQGGKEIYGVESHEAALRLATRRGVLPVLADVEEEGITSPDDTFDAAIMGDVLSYFMDPDYVLSEIHRVLKPGAKFILSVPNLASLGNRLLAVLGHIPYDMDVRPFGGGYQRYYTMASLRTLLMESDFEVVSMETNFVHLPLQRLPLTWRFMKAEPGATRHRFLYWHWLARVMPRLGEDVLVLARKPG